MTALLYLLFAYTLVSTALLFLCNASAPLIGPAETHRVRAYLSLWLSFVLMWPLQAYLALRDRRKEVR